MKVVILAGGMGTRIGEETNFRPKPMIEVGGKPMLWHIMKIYSHYGFNDFVICLGYIGYSIKEYFANYFLHESDVTFDFTDGNRMKILGHSVEPWKVTLVNTGVSTMTGGRLLRVRPHLNDEPFMCTYGDGVGDVDVNALVEHHRLAQRLVTVTATQPLGRFGSLNIAATNEVLGFEEKPKGDGGWVNAGFFVMEPGVFKYLKDDQTVLEREPMESLAREHQLSAFRHDGFWQPMDTMRDKTHLEQLWRESKATWKVWG